MTVMSLPLDATSLSWFTISALIARAHAAFRNKQTPGSPVTVISLPLDATSLSLFTISMRGLTSSDTRPGPLCAAWPAAAAARC